MGSGGTEGPAAWQPNRQLGQPDTLLGAPVYVDPNMAAAGSNARSVIFADMSSYYVRAVGPGPIIDVDRSVFFSTDEIGVRVKYRIDAHDMSGGAAFSSIVQAV